MANQEPRLFLRCLSAAKGKYGTRAEYMRHYRQQHPDYVRRNAASVRKWRQPRLEPVSHTSRDLHVTIESERTSLRIAHVSHTSRDIFVTLETA